MNSVFKYFFGSTPSAAEDKAWRHTDNVADDLREKRDTLRKITVNFQKNAKENYDRLERDLEDYKLSKKSSIS